MSSSDYTNVARGALKLKGGVPNTSITKKKKKKSKQTDLEKNLSTGGGSGGELSKSKSKSRSPSPSPPTTTDAPEQQQQQQKVDQDHEDEEDTLKTKTEAERRFAEVKRKRLKSLASNDPTVSKAGGGIRPELLKTHKQRVEELNSHLSRLSEHHDMPKIGPG